MIHLQKVFFKNIIREVYTPASKYQLYDCMGQSCKSQVLNNKVYPKMFWKNQMYVQVI